MLRNGLVNYRIGTFLLMKSCFLPYIFFRDSVLQNKHAIQHSVACPPHPILLLLLFKIIHAVFIADNNIRFAIPVHILHNELYANARIIINKMTLPHRLILSIFQ